MYSIILASRRWHVPSMCQATWQCSAHIPGLSARNRRTTWLLAGTVIVSRRIGFARFQVVPLGLLPKRPWPQPTIWKVWPLFLGQLTIIFPGTKKGDFLL